MANINPLTNQEYIQRYKELKEVWSSYPSYTKREAILKALESYQLIYIIAKTGAGKTVLLPKFSLEYTKYQGKTAIILPKRIITLSAASFSAETLDVELGTAVGYVYKGSPKEMFNPQNKLIYMTTGIMVMSFVKDPLLSDYDVIILDEAHERRVDIDIIMLFLKKLLESGKRPDLRVIIMSATIDPIKYQNYFSETKGKVINIGGQTMYEINTYFLEEPSQSYMKTGLELVDKLVSKENKKDMLFFITTSNEAFQLCRNIRNEYPRIYCIEVYADMDRDLKIYAEKRDKFLELGNYDQKLVMATNVAESSLTIDGLKYVIDSGYELYSYYDPLHMANILEKRLITKAQALQRRGRVGRTEPGICYHLMTQKQFDSLEEYPLPDILKHDVTLDLIKIILLTDSKTYDQGYQLAEQLMDPPRREYIDVSYELFNLYNIIDQDHKLTKIGYDISQFSSLPLNQSLFLIYAYQLYCAREASIIISMIEKTKGKINNLFYKRDPTMCESGCQFSKKFIRKIAVSQGDHLTLLKLYQTFKSRKDQKKWADKYNIKLDFMNSISKSANKYYNKILNVSRAPKLSRITNTNPTENIIQALILSHKHLVAKNLTTIYPTAKIKGEINKDSVIHLKHKKRDLENKKFIYDDLTNNNNKWEFNMVTMVM